MTAKNTWRVMHKDSVGSRSEKIVHNKHCIAINNPKHSAFGRSWRDGSFTGHCIAKTLSHSRVSLTTDGATQTCGLLQKMQHSRYAWGGRCSNLPGVDLQIKIYQRIASSFAEVHQTHPFASTCQAESCGSFVACSYPVPWMPYHRPLASSFCQICPTSWRAS